MDHLKAETDTPHERDQSHQLTTSGDTQDHLVPSTLTPQKASNDSKEQSNEQSNTTAGGASGLNNDPAPRATPETIKKFLAARRKLFDEMQNRSDMHACLGLEPPTGGYAENFEPTFAQHRRIRCQIWECENALKILDKKLCR